MSRICVKNLPRYVAEDRLRDFFSQKGEVTDAKIMRTKDGKSRQFAFIGFRTITEADDAIKFFNNSYLDTCRITCEVARKVGDPDIPRPWSRYTAKKEDALNDEDKTSVVAKGPVLLNDDGAGIPTNIAKKIKQINENCDSQLQEFLQVMQPRIKTKLWANDTLGFPLLDQSDREKKECQSHKENKKQAARESRNRESGADQEDQSTVLQNGSVVEVSEKKALHELARDEVISDLDYFKSRVKKEWTDSESDTEDLLSEDLVDQEDDEMDGEEAPGVKIGENSHSENFEGENTDKENSSDLNDEKGEVLETGRLFVRNLPYSANEEDLVELFSKHGDVLEVHLVVDRDTKRSKGIAYVLYALPESALRAMQELDNSIFQGRLLHVMPAKQPLEKKESNLGISGVSKTFKQQREEQKKASEASGDTRAWNSLFMRSDTVVENIARKYAVSKSELLDREGNDLAVRIALGETQVIAETKNALINAGFNVEALENFAAGKAEGVKRSGHVILVKNLPYGSSEGDLFKMFSKFGSLDKIFLPSTKTLALVVFLEAAEARTAFKGLAYKRYKDAPLYLEWAPANILTSSSKKKTADQNNQAVGEKNVKRVLLEQNVQGISEVDIDPDRVESRSVFVKNLNFKTTDESLKKHFTDNIKEGKIQSVKIKKHLKNAKTLSMGFGFVEFDSIESAANACRDLQGTVLEGHALLLQLCRGKQNEARVRRTDKDKSSTKLIVRNVAFEATEKDLRQLFSPFGQIKSLRLPMKMGGHRGFAFVEYVTKQEAQNALQALSNTHLYGRHLVLEQAKEGETLEELRARTAAQFSDEQNGFQSMSKLSKKRKHMSTLDEGSVKFERIMGF